MILATGAVHSHLVRQGLRTFTSINVRSAECLDTHYFAVLIGVGATTVNAYLGAGSDRRPPRARPVRRPLGLEECLKRYKKAIDEGLLKIMSKMGISVISSYRGGYNFEAVGLSRTLVADFFPGMPSRISGIGLAGIQQNVRRAARAAPGTERRRRAADRRLLPLPPRRRDARLRGAALIHTLQTAVATDTYATFRKYSDGLRSSCRRPACATCSTSSARAQRRCRSTRSKSITEIRKRFVTPGMSLGALGARGARHAQHRDEPDRREVRLRRGRRGSRRATSRGRTATTPTRRSSRSPRAASASRAEYLNHCREIEIKVAQGAKPGEGGQLPGFKVTEMIAQLRHATPGVMLISPPPHHDIYSIEDLAQLIYDLKQINPRRRVCVKLVAALGHRHDRGRRRQGEGRRHPDLRPCRRHRRLARRPRSSMPACRGRWASPRPTRC